MSGGIYIYDDEYFESKNEYHVMDSFEFENGEVLNEVKVEYMTFGTPIYDEDGQIKNAIIYCHGSLGNYASMKKVAPLVGEGDAFDERRYFFISLTALGSPNSCSPSTTDLKNKFPKYTILDVVNFQKQFLKEKFNLDHVLGIIGNSMGGFVALTSAINYPEYSDFIITGVSSYKVAGHDGNEMIEVDIYDLKYCNESCMYYDVESDLDKIRSKVLIISCKQDPHFPTDLDGIPMAEMIDDSQLIVMDSKLGHLCFNELETISYELREFMGEFDDC